mgnify:CR=1 FL=1
MSVELVTKPSITNSANLDKLKQIRELHRQFGNVVSSNYDISDVCNLKCEGCLYFSGTNNVPTGSKGSTEAWSRFFSTEAGRGVNFGYFSGAEPSLTQDVLRAAMPHIPNGMVTTNGIKKIEKDIRYRIHISLWGGETQSEILRGADNGKKALKNYAGDDRAVAVYTINRQNIEDMVPVSKMCADHGVPITYSYFSPTEDYLERLKGGGQGESSYFRERSDDERILLDQTDFARVRNYIAEAQDKYPDFVWYSLDYDDWLTRPEGIYKLDANGLAVDCGVRMAAHHKHFNVDLERNEGKCCSPQY